jgi:hypothetical protein
VVPYRGQSMNDVPAGQIDVLLDTPAISERARLGLIAVRRDGGDEAPRKSIADLNRRHCNSLFLSD